MSVTSPQYLADSMTDTPAATFPGSRVLADWVRTGAAVCFGYLIVTNGFFFFAGVTQTAVFLGALAAIMCQDRRAGIVIAAILPALLETASPPFLVFDRPLSVAMVGQTFALASATAYGVGALRARWARHDRLIVCVTAGVLVLLVLVNLWIPLVVLGTHPLMGYGPLPAATLRAIPVPGQYTTDDELYRRFFYLLHQGQGHYEAFRDAWLGLRLRGELPSSVSSYRLPTFFWVWRALPADAFLVEVVFLVFASVGVVAAAFIGGQLAGAAVAPLAAAAVAVYGMGIGISVYVTYVDFPASCIALVGVAIWLAACRRDSRRLLWLAAAVFVVAALTREILAYLLLFAAATAFLEVQGRRLRSALPWAVGLAAFAGGYALHAWNVVTRIPVRPGHLDYRQGSPGFALKAVTLFGDVFSGTNTLLAILFVAGVVAAWYVGRRVSTGFGAWAVGVLLVPLLGMLWVGNPGIILQGGTVNYWGNLFVPLALAFAPALLGIGARETGSVPS